MRSEQLQRAVDAVTFTAPCVECGKMVFMLKVTGTSLAVAMDPFSAPVPYWTETSHGYAQPGGGFVRHGCDVDVVAQFRSTWLGQVNIHNELNAAAMGVECPKCGAMPGEKCVNLLERGKGRHAETKAPHADRYPVPSGSA
jgi:hypothetical protein